MGSCERTGTTDWPTSTPLYDRYDGTAGPGSDPDRQHRPPRRTVRPGGPPGGLSLTDTTDLLPASGDRPTEQDTPAPRARRRATSGGATSTKATTGGLAAM